MLLVYQDFLIPSRCSGPASSNTIQVREKAADPTSEEDDQVQAGGLWEDQVQADDFWETDLSQPFGIVFDALHDVSHVMQGCCRLLIRLCGKSCTHVLRTSSAERKDRHVAAAIAEHVKDDPHIRGIPFFIVSYVG